MAARYFTFVKSVENPNAQPPQAMYEAMDKHIRDFAKTGRLIDTGGLAPMAMSKHVRLSGGNISVKDGPFTEAKEVIGGYAVMEFESEEQALQEAKAFLELHRTNWPEWEGEVEIRQIFRPDYLDELLARG